MNLNFLRPRKIAPKTNVPSSSSPQPSFNGNLYKRYQWANKEWINYFRYSFLGVISVISAFLCLLLIRQAQAGVYYFGGWWLILSLFILSLSIIPLMALVLETKRYLLWCLIMMAAYLLPVIDYFNQWILLASLIMLIAFIVGGLSSKFEAANYLKFKWSRLARKGLRYLTFGVLLFIIAVFYVGPKDKILNFNLNNLTSGNFKIAGRELNLASKLNLNMKVDEMISNLISNEAGNNLSLQEIPLSLTPTLMKNVNKIISQQKNDQLKKEMIEGVRGELNKQFGLNLTGQETVLEAIINYFKSQNKGPWLYALYLILILTALSLLTSLIWLINLLVLALGYILLEILLAVGYFKLDTKGTVQEVLVINQ